MPNIMEKLGEELQAAREKEKRMILIGDRQGLLRAERERKTVEERALAEIAKAKSALARKILTARVIDGFTPTETAYMLGISRSTYYRCVKKVVL